METVDKTLNQELASMDDSRDWERRVVVAGGILGAFVGVVTSMLLIRTSREAHAGPPAINTSDAFKVGITAIGLVRSIAALGDRQR
ncbi:MAG TPA: hypothetical protein PLH39_03895 [Promineifilum sp.]|nr:hypothetical protein [Promineifilum sp.]